MRKAPPICFEKGVDILPIFRKLIKESSSFVVAVNAETQEEADKAFDEYIKSDKGKWEIKGMLFENEERSIRNLHTFPNEDAYNSSCVRLTDIDITKKEEKDG